MDAEEKSVAREVGFMWRGSVTDLATDLKAALAQNQLYLLAHLLADLSERPRPVALVLWCPCCATRHIDEGEWATKPHHTHACQHCGHVWRPAIVPTVGVRFLPGFKNEETPQEGA